MIPTDATGRPSAARHKRLVLLARRGAAVTGAAVAGLVVAGAAVPALAQTVPTPGAVLQQTAPAPAPVAAPTAPIVLPARKARKTGSTLPIPVRRLVITGNHLIATARLEKLVAPAEGRTLTLDQLDAVVHRITDAYHQEGYPVAYAYLPAQTVRAGVIRIDVVEPRYDRIEVTGRSRFSAAQVRRTLGVRAGQPVAEGPLSRGLLLLQQTPGLRVNGMLLPGAAPGTSSLKIARKDAPLLSGSFTLTNHGNAYTGRALGTLAVTAADPFGQGSALSADVSASQTGDLKAGGLNAVSPDLGNGLRFGAYADWTDYRLGGAFASLDQVGRARQLGADVTYPLILAPGRLLDLRFDLIDTRLTQNTRTTGAETRQHLRIARLALSGALAGANGAVTSGRVALSVGTLGLAPAAARAADAAGPNAAGGFAVLRFRLARDQPLGKGFALHAALSGQLSDRNLDSSQQFYLGGPDGVMSTDVGAGGGDEGVLLRLRLSHALKSSLPGALDLQGLAQWGAVRVNHSPYAGATGPNTLSAGALGLGLGYRIHRWSLEAAAVAPLGGHGVTTGARLWLSASVGF